MPLPAGNLFAHPLPAAGEEAFETLLAAGGARIERIVSLAAASPEGFWYEQPQGEWVVLLSGSALLHIEGEPELRRLVAGDWLYLPPRCRHRVEATDPLLPSLWLALFLPPSEIDLPQTNT